MAGYENVLSGRNDRSGLRKGSTTDKFSHIVTIRTTFKSYIHHKSPLFGSQADMSEVSPRPVSTSIPDVTGTYTLNKPPRSRISRFGSRSTLELSDDDDMELRHLLSPSTDHVYGYLDAAAETDIAWISDPTITPQNDLQAIISDTHISRTDDREGSDEVFTRVRPSRKVVHALFTLIRDITTPYTTSMESYSTMATLRHSPHPSYSSDYHQFKQIIHSARGASGRQEVLGCFTSRILG